MEPQRINCICFSLQGWKIVTLVLFFLLRDLEKKNMLDPICTVRDRNKTKLSPKTMVRFCRGDPVLVTGDING